MPEAPRTETVGREAFVFERKEAVDVRRHGSTNGGRAHEAGLCCRDVTPIPEKTQGSP
jgi:hypothetical protein